MPAVVAPFLAEGALGATALTAGAGALETGILAGSALAGGAELAGMLGSGLAGAAPATAGLASIPGIPEIAPAALAQATQTIAPSIAQSAGLDALKMQALSQGAGNAGFNAAANALPQVSNQVGFNQLLNEFGRQGLGQNLTQLGPQLAGPADASTFTPEAVDLTGEAAKWQQYAKDMGYTTPGGPAATIARSATPGGITKGGGFLENAMNLIRNPSWQNAKDYAEEHPYATSAAAGLAAQQLFKQEDMKGQAKQPSYIRPYDLNVQNTSGQPYDTSSSAERQQLTYNFAPRAPYEVNSETVKKAVGGPVETMSAQNAVGQNLSYPQAGIDSAMYANPMAQRPIANNVIKSGVDVDVDPFTGEQRMATGGIASLGSYSDGGRLLKGPGDGVSDSIPAQIGDHQPARLADGEFVVPARIVSELGNGSTEAGARKLYAMMDRVQKSRRKSVGKGKVAVDSKADKHLPA